MGVRPVTTTADAIFGVAGEERRLGSSDGVRERDGTEVSRQQPIDRRNRINGWVDGPRIRGTDEVD